jgi:hypothetical protein
MSGVGWQSLVSYLGIKIMSTEGLSSHPDPLSRLAHPPGMPD